MIEFYDSLNNFEAEIVINRSRFIGRVYRIDDESCALDILKSLKKEFSDATHICYGYVADLYGTARFSDGGEPSGTAGKPIIDLLIKRGLKRVLAVVIRYFGGIKLGAGGLTRAYGECAGRAMDGAEKLRYTLCEVYKSSMDFAAAKRLKSCFTAAGKILEAQYSDTVTILAAIPKLAAADFEKNVAEISGGKAQIERLYEEYINLG